MALFFVNEAYFSARLLVGRQILSPDTNLNRGVIQPLSSIEISIYRFALVCEKHKFIILILITAIYISGTIFRARAKPFWYDEVMTIIAADAPDVKTTLKVARAVDASPALIHVLTHFSIRWFGKGEIAVRLPAILGFWIFCLCMFRFTARRAGIFYAFVALFIPFGTVAYDFSIEARAYGPELAFCGLALIGWQASGDRPKGALGPAGVALGLAGAFWCHYYAILCLIPLAGAEAYRSYCIRRIDWRVWAAFTASMLPLVWHISAIIWAVDVNTHTWAPPAAAQILRFWDDAIHEYPAILFLGLTALTAILLPHELHPIQGKPSTPPNHEILAGVLFLMIPTAAVLGALLITHTFIMRYALIAVCGFSFLLPLLIFRLSGGRVMTGFLLLVTSVVPFFLQMAVSRKIPHNPFDGETLLQEALVHEPVVIPDGFLFLQLWHYSPSDLKSKLIFVADPGSAAKYIGFDTIDLGLMLLRPWAAMTVTEYDSFATPGREFLVYESHGAEWLIRRILAEGGSVKHQACTRDRCLLKVRMRD